MEGSATRCSCDQSPAPDRTDGHFSLDRWTRMVVVVLGNPGFYYARTVDAPESRSLNGHPMAT